MNLALDVRLLRRSGNWEKAQTLWNFTLTEVEPESALVEQLTSFPRTTLYVHDCTIKPFLNLCCVLVLVPLYRLMHDTPTNCRTDFRLTWKGGDWNFVLASTVFRHKSRWKCVEHVSETMTTIKRLVPNSAELIALSKRRDHIQIFCIRIQAVIKSREGHTEVSITYPTFSSIMNQISLLKYCFSVNNKKTEIIIVLFIYKNCEFHCVSIRISENKFQ